MSSATYWAEANHAAGRLVSYQYAVESLTVAHHIWANTDLFVNFDVGFLRSSAAHPNPVKDSPLHNRKAENIIGKMVSNPRDREVYKVHAQDMQAYDLDDKIADQWRTTMVPRVHGEMLILDWLQRTPGGTRAHRFFRGWRYIGSSKPTCRLCRYYFDNVAPEVQTRPTHNNIYYNWRMPDIYPSDGEAGQTRWRDTMNAIKARIHGDALGLLRDKVPDRKKNDSNTLTARIADTESAVAARGGSYRRVTGREDGSDGMAALTTGLQGLALIEAQVGGARR